MIETTKKHGLINDIKTVLIAYKLLSSELDRLLLEEKTVDINLNPFDL